MKREYQDVITSYLGVEPIKINSALVSAQSRERLYWTNIPISGIKDRGIKIADVIDFSSTSDDIIENPPDGPKVCRHKYHNRNKKSKYLKQVGYFYRDSQGYRV